MTIKKLFLITVLLLSYKIGYTQADNVTSDNAEPFCIGLTYTSTPEGESASTLEPENDYGCLASSPNPSWFFLKCSESGSIDLELMADFDVDFIIYGPFADYADMLTEAGTLTGSSIVDCSYSGVATETISIPDMLTGEYYLLLVTNYAAVVQPINLNQTGGSGSLDCSVYAESSTQLIFGKTFFDENNNGVFDGEDIFISGVEVEIDPLDGITFSNASGVFYFFNETVDTVEYTVTASLDDFEITTTPESYSFELDSVSVISDTLLFGFYPDSLYYAVSGDIVVNSVSCVVDNIMWVNIHNDGTLPSEGIITVLLDSNVYYDTAYYPLESIDGHELTFEYDSLSLFESLNFQILTTPDVSLVVGDTIKTIFSIESFDTLDVSLGIQTDTLCSPVFCSYDPNFKESLINQGLPSEFIQPQDSIEYVIHFQNTGTAPASFVIIEDSIDTNLDLNSFKFLSSSHDVNILIDSNRLVNFTFNDINLPDSNTNEPLSHGYVKFQLNLIEGLLPHDSIFNDVAIFFDYNAPIYTNTVHNIIDCYIIPDLSSTMVYDNRISTNLTDPDLTFEWTYNGEIIPDATNSYLDFDAGGIYLVTATNEYGCQSTYEYSSSLSLEEIELQIQFHPNPFTEGFVLSNPSLHEFNIKIIDLNGQLVYVESNITESKVSIDASDWSRGVYLVDISDENGSVVRQKLVKN